MRTYPVLGTHDENTLAQMDEVAKNAHAVALMADGHRGYVMPIGGVAAYRNHVAPVGVGVDIACGNCAIMTDLKVDDLEGRWSEVADEIADTIGFGMGRPTNLSDDAPTDHPLFESDHWYRIPHRTTRLALQQRARAQLGTVGGGNHYVDVFRDTSDRVWVGVHFGSRGLGYNIAHGVVALAQGEQWDDLRPQRVAKMDRETLLHVDSELATTYWGLMTLAGEYAYAGREWVARTVVGIMGGNEVKMVHNHHNFAWVESHGGEDLIVVRKGATPAFPGQEGFVGGSMGDVSVIIRGVDSDDSERLLRSTVHGAGRVMGRMAAKGKWKRGELVRPGKVSHEMMRDATLGVHVRGGDLDEAPQVYRSLWDVLRAHRGTIEVDEILHPLIVCMAPPRTRDPFKD